MGVRAVEQHFREVFSQQEARGKKPLCPKTSLKEGAGTKQLSQTKHHLNQETSESPLPTLLSP